MDRAKVIKGLELCEIGSDDRCYERECPYYGHECTEGLKSDILALLKEQEAVKPYLKAGGWYCGSHSCRTLLGAGGSQREDEKTKAYSLFCRKCGRRIKWDA